MRRMDLSKGNERLSLDCFWMMTVPGDVVDA